MTASTDPDNLEATPTGTVNFKDGATIIGHEPLVELSTTTGVTTFSTSTLDVGTHPITADYTGATSIHGSMSAVLDQVVNPADTTTTVTSSANPSVFGQPVTFTATVTANRAGQRHAHGHGDLRGW